MLTWIWVAVVVIALIILIAAIVPLLGRLGRLRRAGERLQTKQIEVVRLRSRAAELETAVQGLRERAEQAQRTIAVIKAGRGED